VEKLLEPVVVLCGFVALRRELANELTELVLIKDSSSDS
jgi:hypothetical protein